LAALAITCFAINAVIGLPSAPPRAAADAAAASAAVDDDYDIIDVKLPDLAAPPSLPLLRLNGTWFGAH